MSNYYTVTEFAKRTGKDPGNIRRKLINGMIEGEKLGNQWIIPKGTEYPMDSRVKSGEYKNWRKRAYINKCSPKLLNALTEMSSQISKVYGDNLDRVILYGSYARGEQTDESDVDIAIMLKNGNDERMHDAMIDIVVEYELSLSRTLSVIPIEYENYNEWKTVLPFYKNLDMEGIVIWKSA